jgi:predicted nucleic acid-binding protein
MDTGRAEMKLVLDASMTLAWHIERADPGERMLARQALRLVRSHGALVPALWYCEVANAVLVAERRGVSTEQQGMVFQADLKQLEITMDSALPEVRQPTVIALGRSSGLTGYDAAYLELVLRTGRALATFDRQLAEAVRKAGGEGVWGSGVVLRSHFESQVTSKPPRFARAQ